MALPEDIDSLYPDRNFPGDKDHQQHHNVIHAAVNEYNDRAASGGDLEPGSFPSGVDLSAALALKQDAATLNQDVADQATTGDLEETLSARYVRRTDTAQAGGTNIVSSESTLLGPSGDQRIVFGGTTLFPHRVYDAVLPTVFGYDNQIWDNAIATHNAGHHGIAGHTGGHATIGGGSMHVNFGAYGVIGGGTDCKVFGNTCTVGGGVRNAVGANVASALTVAIVASDTTATVADATGVAIGMTAFVGSGTPALGGAGGQLESARVASIAGNVITFDTFRAVSTINLDGTLSGTSFVAAHNIGAVVYFTDYTQTNGTIGGGSDNLITGQFGTIAGGRNNVVKGVDSFAAGNGHVIESANSVGLGKETRTLQTGQQALANGMFSTPGDAQTSVRVQKTTTTNATTTSQQVLLNPASGVAMVWQAVVIAHDTATGDAKAWKIEGALRVSGTTVTAIGGAPTATVVAADAGASAWTLATLAGTGTYNLRLTGEASKTIRWVTRFEFTEVI